MSYLQYILNGEINQMLKRLGKSLFLFIIMFLIFASVNATPSEAATIGQKLTASESGWARYDDKSSAIVYTGTFWKSYTNSNMYNGDLMYTSSTTIGQKFEFTMVGSKFRIIANKATDRSKNIEVKVDGSIVGNYSEYTTISTSEYQILVFEHTGLTYGNHKIEVTIIEAGKMSLDAIDIDDSGYLVDPSSISAPSNLVALAGNATIDLQWDGVAGAESYILYRASTLGGPYETVSSNIYGTTYSDNTVSNGVTYYYVVSAASSGQESSYSNEVSATPTAPVVNRAILVVTLSTGLEKEYDLSMSEVNNFISWYEAKANGAGSIVYAIDKDSNNKGPFVSRKDYIIFDKVLTFEVNEYTAQ
jgi:hypothetical protein